MSEPKRFTAPRAGDHQEAPPRRERLAFGAGQESADLLSRPCRAEVVEYAAVEEGRRSRGWNRRRLSCVTWLAGGADPVRGVVAAEDDSSILCDLEMRAGNGHDRIDDRPLGAPLPPPHPTVCAEGVGGAVAVAVRSLIVPRPLWSALPRS